MEDLQAAADQILKDDAERQGLSYTEYCNKRGILGPMQYQRIKRHEVPLAVEGD